MHDDRIFGFGIVGAGAISRVHARAISELPQARLVGIAHTAEAGDLFARPEVDVMCICVPSGRHAELGIKAARAGKHVVVEKPIEVSLEAADRLIAACLESGVQLAVISQHRFSPGARKVRELIDQERLGRLILGDAIVKWHRSQQYYDSAGWRATWELDGGGALINQGIHSVDLLRWMMGPVERVFAYASTAAHERIEVEDVLTGVLRFEGGAIGVVEASTAVYPGLPERLEVTGTRGTVILESGAIRLCAIVGEPAAGPVEGRPAAGGSTDPMGISYEGHREQLADLVHVLEAGGRPAVGGEEGRQALELVLAIYESARTGREVSLPLS